MNTLVLLLILSIPLCQPLQASNNQLLRPSLPEQPEQIVQRLSLDQKVGQLIMAAAIVDEELNFSALGNNFAHSSVYTMHKEHVTRLIEDYHIGGIIYLGYSKPALQIARTNHYQTISKLPLLIGQDLEWGLSTRILTTLRFPRAMTLGALQDNHLIYQMTCEVARQAKLLGVHIVFAPVADVNNNSQNPVIGDRSFGADPDQVAHKGEQFMRGLQDNGIIACAKHFPGHGDTAVDSHHDLPHIAHAREHLDSIELVPFKHLINSGVKAIMTAHLEVPALEATPHLPTSLSRATITQLLKQELNFDGLVITDGLGMRGITLHHALGEIEARAMQAGTDIVLCPVDVPKAHAALKQAVLDGRISHEELNKKVVKILHAKQWVLQNSHTDTDTRPLDEALHTQQAYALKKKLYQDAITMARDDARVIPLPSSNQSIALIEYGAPSPTPCADILREKKVCSYSTAYYINPKDVVEQIKQDTVVVTIGNMNKFASQNFGISDAALRSIEAIQASGKSVVVVLFGSPYSIKLLPNVATIVVAYEDDRDAQEAAARVIVGECQARGTLPI